MKNMASITLHKNIISAAIAAIAKTVAIAKTAAIAAVAVFAAGGFGSGAAFAQEASPVWTGGSRSWNDAKNWAGRAAPAPSKAIDFVFDSPAGNSFAFSTPFEAGGVIASTNAGAFSFKAPQIRIGGNIVDETADGWILEDVFKPGLVVNNSANPLTFSGETRLCWDSALDAAGGPIIIAGGIDGGGRALQKLGAGELRAEGGKISVKNVSIDAGRFALHGAAAEIASPETFGKNSGAELLLADGATLAAGANAGRGGIEFAPRLEMRGTAKRGGGASVFDAGGNTLNLHSKSFSLRDGASITNAAEISVYMRAPDVSAIEGLAAGGAKISSPLFVLGNTSQGSLRFATNITMTLRGIPDASAKNQTTLDLGGSGRLVIGSRTEHNTRAEDVRMIVTDGARVENVRVIGVSPWRLGGHRNSLRIDKGAYVSGGVMIVGSTGVSNAVEISGAKTKAIVGGGDVFIGGYGDTWNGAAHNSLKLADGASLQVSGSVYIGRSSTNGDFSDHGNHLHVAGGASLKAKNITAGSQGHRKGGATSNNWARIEGRGTRWDADGGRLTVAYAEGGYFVANQALVMDGALITNISAVSIGVASSSSCASNRLVIANGARASTKGIVQIGVGTSNHLNIRAEGNTIQLAGGKDGPALWDMGGGELVIGHATGRTSSALNNKFILYPNSQATSAGAISIGRGIGPTSGNAIVLAGGGITAKSLYIAKNNGIDVTLTSAGIKPILIEGAVSFDDAGAKIIPTAMPGAQAGRYPLLGWKGEAKNIAKLSLDDNADKRKWKLEIDEANKRVFLVFTL